MTTNFFTKFTELLAESDEFSLDPPGYNKRVEELEAEGMTRSDAQGVADYEYETGKGPWATKEVTEEQFNEAIAQMRKIAGLTKGE